MKYGCVDGIFFSPGTGSDFGGRPTATLLLTCAPIKGILPVNEID